MATKKKSPDAKTTKVKLTRTVPATMITPGDYRGANVPMGATRTLPADVAARLVKAGHAEEA